LKLLRIVTVFVSVCLLFGCAVSQKPFSETELLSRIESDRKTLYAKQEPITEQLSLEEAMARALMYNLDHRIKLMEDALSLRQVDLAKFDMLPRVVAAAGYNVRNEWNASSSQNVYTEQQSLSPSTSTDKAHSNLDIMMTWNILDFGVSYFHARQQSDRALIMSERRRKVVHTIIQQVRHAYWQALGAQQMEGRFQPLLKDVERALQDSKKSEAEKLRSPIEALSYQKTLLEIMKQLEAFRDELSQAKMKLSSLINVSPGQNYRLALPASMDKPKLPEDLSAMESRALYMRPELMEADYNKRISVNETRKAILRMLPGIEISAGWHYDSNSFLVWNNWLEGGARVAWNLINLINGPIQLQVANAQTEIALTNRLALSMAVLTQVHLAYYDFLSKERQYDLSKELQEIDAGINQHTQNAFIAGSQGRLNAIRASIGSMMADFRSYQNYAALQNAYGQISATVGVDPIPEEVKAHDVKTITEAVRISLSRHWKPLPAALDSAKAQTEIKDVAPPVKETKTETPVEIKDAAKPPVETIN